MLFFPIQLFAQFTVTPFIGLNSTRMSQSIGYENGGNYPVFGAEVEYMFKHNKYSMINLSVTSGASYLANGFDQITNSSFNYTDNGTTINYYDAKSTQIQMKYWQVPLLLRINVRPFPLLEDWRLFLGFGIVSNNLTQAHLAEQWTHVQKTIRDPRFTPSDFPPPTITQAQDSRDVTSYAVKSSIFERFEFGMKFKHVQICYRFTVSTQDMYFKGIEKVWNVPAVYSQYISAHNARGTTNEKYSEIVFGWRF